jgi:hypothetical protein
MLPPHDERCKLPHPPIVFRQAAHPPDDVVAFQRGEAVTEDLDNLLRALSMLGQPLGSSKCSTSSTGLFSNTSS